MSKPLPDHQAPAAATVSQVTAAASASPASKPGAAAAHLGQELNNEVAAMINTPPSPAVRRSVVQLDTVAPQLSMRPPSFAFVASAETPRLPSQSSAAPAADDEFSSEYSNHSERDPTEAFETDVEFKMCERPPNEPAASGAVDDNDDQDENCDTENFEKTSPAAAGPVWIIPPESDKPKKKKNKKKKRVEKDT